MNSGLRNDELLHFVKNAKNNNSVIVMDSPCKQGCIFCSRVQDSKNHSVPLFTTNTPSNKQWDIVISNLDFSKDINFDTNDAFDCPEIYNVIDKINEEGKSRDIIPQMFISSTMGGFDSSKIELLKSTKNLTMELSLMTFNTNFKNNIMRGGWTEKQTQTLKKVIESDIAKIIAVWSFGDIELLKKDLEILRILLSKCKKQTTLLFKYPFSTRFSNEDTKKLTQKSLSNWNEALKLFYEFMLTVPKHKWSFTVTNISSTDIANIPSSYHINKLRDEFKNRMNFTINILETQNKIKKTCFILSKSVYSYAKNQYPTLNIICPEYTYYGGSITSGQLLVFEDIYRAIIMNPNFDSYVINKDMVKSDKDYLGITLRQLTESTKKEIILG